MSKEAREEKEKLEQIDTSKLVAQADEEMQQNEIVTLPNGIRVQFRSVAPDLLRRVQADIIDPPIPKLPHPDDPERKIENPHDPDYLAALNVANQKRTDAIMQAMVLRGVTLIDGMPEDDEWLDDLVFLGVVDKGDAKDAGDRLKEIWYKRFIALDTTGFDLLQKKMGLNEEMVASASKTFQRNT